MNCPQCGRPNEKPNRKHCSRSCAMKSIDRSGPRNSRWKGGRRIRSDGYVLRYVPTHPYANKNFVLEHRLVMEAQVGRYLKPHEIVHHKNHNRSDNRLENLELMTLARHAAHHNTGHTYVPPKLSKSVAIKVRNLYWSNPRKSRWNKDGYSVIGLAQQFKCSRVTVLDAIHRQGAYAR